ncbi:MAG TPA: hypothetical protein VMW42_13620 [Desulfatiglandales bacterium]|nr:hypothetical protein [Desulfatiglandales bacterium]
MLIIHPIIQCLSILLAIYVFYLGAQRFRSLHFHQQAIFQWKLHVLLGGLSLVAFITGIFGGMVMVYLYWHSILITNIHAKVAFIMAPFIVFGFLSGLHINLKKEKKSILALIHGINNFLVLIFALIQIFTGWWVYRTFVLGG